MVEQHKKLINGSLLLIFQIWVVIKVIFFAMTNSIFVVFWIYLKKEKNNNNPGVPECQLRHSQYPFLSNMTTVDYVLLTQLLFLESWHILLPVTHHASEWTKLRNWMKLMRGNLKIFQNFYCFLGKKFKFRAAMRRRVFFQVFFFKRFFFDRNLNFDSMKFIILALKIYLAWFHFLLQSLRQLNSCIRLAAPHWNFS